LSTLPLLDAVRPLREILKRFVTEKPAQVIEHFKMRADGPKRPGGAEAKQVLVRNRAKAIVEPVTDHRQHEPDSRAVDVRELGEFVDPLLSERDMLVGFGFVHLLGELHPEPAEHRLYPRRVLGAFVEQRSFLG
jgi:hypothetical protein